MSSGFDDLFTEIRPIDPTEELYKQIELNFSGISPALDAGLSNWAELLIVDISLPSALLYVGRPSGNKTNVVNIMRGSQDSIYLDELSQASFISHLNVSNPSKLDKIDLLPQLPGKMLLTPEMNTFWNQPKDKLATIIGKITRILDGQGYTSHSGVHGKRGYEGKFNFVWLAGTTPIPRSVWISLGKLGSRMYFYPLDSETPDDDELVASIQSDNTYDERMKNCRQLVHNFMMYLRKEYPKGVAWDRKSDDPKLIKKIARYAELIARLRGHIEIEYDEKGNFEIDSPLIENYSRATQWLYNMARGHALIHGRLQLTNYDIPLLRQIAFSSAPYDRVRAIKLLLDKKTMLIDDFTSELRVTKKPAMRICRTLAALGLVELFTDPLGQIGRPPTIIALKKRFEDLAMG